MPYGATYTRGSIIRRPKQALYIAIVFFAVGIFFLLCTFSDYRNHKSLEDIEIGLIISIFFSIIGIIFLIAEKKKIWKRNLEQIKKLK